MSDWKRTTKEAAFEGLRPELVAAIKSHIEQYNLGDILSGVLMCIQTDSEKIKKGLFGGTEIVYTGAVITPRWLIWGVSGTKTQSAVLSALLADIVVQDYAKTQFVKLVPDSGINVSGKFTDISENGSAFIGLGGEPAAGNFKEVVITSVQEAKR